MKLLLAAFAALAALCLSNARPGFEYPPLISSRFPLTTPAAFWASSLGMRRLAADIVWVQALQYYGTRDQTEAGNELGRTRDEVRSLYPGLKSYWQQVLRLDPLFVEVYLTGPVTLGWNLKRHDEALSLINEGLAALEEVKGNLSDHDIQYTGKRHPLLTGTGPYLEELRWKLYTLKTILVYLENEKFSEALPALEKLAFSKDTPDIIKNLLAQIYAKNKYYRKSLYLWQALYDTTSDPALKESALRHISNLSRIISSDVSPLQEVQ